MNNKENKEKDKIFNIKIEVDVELDVKAELNNSKIEDSEDEYMEILFKFVIRREEVLLNLRVQRVRLREYKNIYLEKKTKLQSILTMHYAQLN
ncbi:12698_t:CDS:2 [Funneliformis geosporum]|uniref:12698_t:CDS:1 n=1 Tax=Funneliformis geosporum TaxID=1117311 RepID=A0A9W4WVF5_9GLOM|nr:12698_t:CDS:2 [Funneliformis geosporum]